MSRILSTGGGVCLSACWDTPQSRPTSPSPDQTPPGPDTTPTTPTPWDQTPLPGPDTLWTRHPRTRHTPLGPDTPPGTRQPLGPDTPTPQDQTPTPRDQTPPWDQTPPPRSRLPRSRQPQEQTAPYGLRAAGTHPTGMHSCNLININALASWKMGPMICVMKYQIMSHVSRCSRGSAIILKSWQENS